MFSHISFALKDTLPATSLLFHALHLACWELGRKERLKITWPPAFCLWEHPSSDQCPHGVETDFPLETRIKQSCQMHNLPFQTVCCFWSWETSRLCLSREGGGNGNEPWTSNLSPPYKFGDFLMMVAVDLYSIIDTTTDLLHIELTSDLPNFRWFYLKAGFVCCDESKVL